MYRKATPRAWRPSMTQPPLVPRLLETEKHLDVFENISISTADRIDTFVTFKDFGCGEAHTRSFTRRKREFRSVFRREGFRNPKYADHLVDI